MLIKKTVIIVDDEKEVLEVVSESFTQRGYNSVAFLTVAEAKNGIIALISGGMTISAIVTDIKMPGEDGCSFLRWVSDFCPQVKCFVLTGHAAGCKDLKFEAVVMDKVPTMGVGVAETVEAHLYWSEMGKREHAKALRKRDRKEADIIAIKAARERAVAKHKAFGEAKLHALRVVKKVG